MSIEIPKSYGEAAFLGKSNIESQKRLIEVNANRIIDQKILDTSINPVERATRARALVVGFGTGVDNVSDLINITRDRSKSETQKINAECALTVLNKSVFLVMNNGGVADWKTKIVQGPAEVDDILPTPMKGLGERVVKNLITNKDILDTLNGLDIIRRRTDINVPFQREVLRKKIEEETSKLMTMRINPAEEDQLILVLAYLSTEAGVIADELKLTKDIDPLDRIALGRGMEEQSTIERKEGQLRLVRQVLNEIEARGTHTRTTENSEKTAQLEKMLSRIDPDVAVEVRSRLNLIDSFIFMRKAAGRIKAPETGADMEAPNLAAAVERATANGHAFDKETIGFLLADNNINGLPVGKAWTLLEEANLKYGTFLNRLALDERMNRVEKEKLLAIGTTYIDDDPTLGNTDTTYYSDKNEWRKGKVKEFMVRQLGGNPALARKAVELAYNLAYATGETSVFNASMTGTDELAELIYFDKWRKGRARTGRPRGPMLHEGKIDSLGNSWLRSISGVGQKGILKHTDVKIDNIEEGNYLYHFGVLVTAKWQPLKEMFLDRSPDPKKILDKTNFENIVDNFNKADPPYDVVMCPDGKVRRVDKEKVTTRGRQVNRQYVDWYGRKFYIDSRTVNQEEQKWVNFGREAYWVVKSKTGEKQLKTWWLAGVVQMAVTQDNLGWRLTDLIELKRMVTEEVLSPEAGTFLLPKQWKWIEKINNAMLGIRALESQRRRIGRNAGPLSK